jgi:hypothetical protein
MKKVILAAILATVALTARAGEDSTDRWFHDGLAWYQQPCGLSAFSKYGDDDSPAVRHAYFLTKHNPELCSKLFP